MSAQPQRKSNERKAKAIGSWLEFGRASLPQRVTWKEIARQAGCTHSHLLYIRSGEESPSAALLQRLEEVLDIPFNPNIEQSSTPPEPPDESLTLMEILERFWDEVPVEEMAKLPKDGAEQHDHYIYGWPKLPVE